MTEVFSSEGPLPTIPDDLTIPQFILDSQHCTRPIRPVGIPWLIEDGTGKKVGVEELRARTFGVANSMSSRWNVGENTVVCIFAPNHIDYPVVIWAVHRLGGIITAANPTYTPDELVHQLTSTKSSLFFVHPAMLATALSASQGAGIPHDRIILFDAISNSNHPTLNGLVTEGLSQDPTFIERRLSPGEGKTKIAFLSFSSGTTGKPKAVAIPHYSLIANVIQVAAFYKINDPSIPWEDLRYRPGDVASGVLPLFHIYGLVLNLHLILFSGMSVVIIPKFNFVELLNSIVRFRMTHLLLVPPMLVLLCKHPAVKKYDFSHVRVCMSGAAPLSMEIVEQLGKLFPAAAIGQGYGLTETSTAVAMLPRYQKVGASGSTGRLLPGVEARVVKADGSLANTGESGELVVTGPSMALEYHDNSKETKETFLDINGKRWVRTGDEVLFDEHGDLFIVDRIKELIKVRGFQVAPAELEGHLLGHPDVADVCVVGAPDEYSGELPLAYVVLQSQTAQRIKQNPNETDKVKAAIQKHVADVKTSYKWLAGGVEFIEQIPKNPSGKLLRKDLRAKARQAAASKFKAKL